MERLALVLGGQRTSVGKTNFCVRYPCDRVEPSGDENLILSSDPQSAVERAQRRGDQTYGFYLAVGLCRLTGAVHVSLASTRLGVQCTIFPFFSGLAHRRHVCWGDDDRLLFCRFDQISLFSATLLGGENYDVNYSFYQMSLWLASAFYFPSYYAQRRDGVAYVFLE